MNTTNSTQTLHVYTKNVIPKTYDAGLANSIHFELTSKGSRQELNCGYGMLFPKACIKEDNTIDPRGALNPQIIQDEKRYLIICDYVNEAGNNMAPGRKYAWETTDFTSFNELGLINNPFPSKAQNTGADTIPLPDSFIPKILSRWVPPYGIRTDNPRQFRYPLVKGFADPVVFPWNGKWYYLATNDINGNIGIFMREADNIDDLFDDGEGAADNPKYKLSVILDYDEENEFIQTFWAPEWHIIGGVPYILFAVGKKEWGPQSHMMRYKGEGSIMSPESWDKPVRVCKQDGSFLCEDGITLDMTYLHTPKANYVVWSERYHIGTALDSGSMLYIGTIDSSNPTRLTSDKILLSRPLYGWENVAGTINNEGPYCFVKDNRVIVSYSGGDACGHYYAVGFLAADTDTNLLDTDNWEKSQTPFFNAYTLTGIDGPGHSSFFVDEFGNDMIAFHGQDSGRQSGIHPFYMTEDGRPVVI